MKKYLVQRGLLDSECDYPMWEDYKWYRWLWVAKRVCQYRSGLGILQYRISERIDCGNKE